MEEEEVDEACDVAVAVAVAVAAVAVADGTALGTSEYMYWMAISVYSWTPRINSNVVMERRLLASLLGAVASLSLSLSMVVVGCCCGGG